MNDSSGERERLREELREVFRDRESREVYAQGFLHTWISAQLATVRQQRGLTQKALAEQIGTKQPGIARMERDDYGKWNLATLVKVAAALDCRLKVSLETYGSLLEEVVAFVSPQYLERVKFEQDSVFRSASAMDWQGIDQPGPIGEMRRKWLHWFESGSRKETVVKWLQGAGLPAVGEEDPPSYWLAEGLRGAPDPVQDHANRIMELLLHQVSEEHPDVAEERIQVELFELVAALEKPTVFEDPLLHLSQAWSKLEWADLLKRPAGRALSRAMRHNQNSARFRNQWLTCIERADPEKPALSLSTGFLGLQRIPNAPNAIEIGAGCIQFDRTWARKRESRVHEEFRKTIIGLACDAQRADFPGDILEACKVQVSEPTLFILGSAYMASPTARLHHRVKDSTFLELEFILQHSAAARPVQ